MLDGSRPEQRGAEPKTKILSVIMVHHNTLVFVKRETFVRFGIRRWIYSKYLKRFGAWNVERLMRLIGVVRPTAMFVRERTFDDKVHCFYLVEGETAGVNAEHLAPNRYERDPALSAREQAGRIIRDLH